MAQMKTVRGSVRRAEVAVEPVEGLLNRDIWREPMANFQYQVAFVFRRRSQKVEEGHLRRIVGENGVEPAPDEKHRLARARCEIQHINLWQCPLIIQTTR